MTLTRRGFLIGSGAAAGSAGLAGSRPSPTSGEPPATEDPAGSENGVMTLSARLLFLRALLHDPTGVGSITPSSPGLARALAAPVRERAGRPTSVLEVGAGTGPVTRTLLGLLPAGSRLDVVEANAAFIPGLQALVAGAAADVGVHGCRIEDLDVGHRYDVIISCLPFTNMALAEVAAALGRYQELAPDGTVTWVSYLGSRRARALTASAARLARHIDVEDLLRRQGGRSATVWANLPPARVTRARVRDLRADTTSDSPPPAPRRTG